MENPLNRGRVPPIDPPEPSTPPCCVVVPGAYTEYSFTSPPVVLIGTSCTARPLKVASNAEDSVFTRSAPASTSTVTDTEPSSRSTFASVVWFEFTTMPFCTAFLNPSFSTVTAYVPTNKFGNTYVPELEAVVVTATPVSSFSAVTFAPSILAWLLSVTVTRSVPSKRCARAALPSNIQSTPASAMKISLRIASLLQSYRIVLLTFHAAFSTTRCGVKRGRCTQHST